METLWRKDSSDASIVLREGYAQRLRDYAEFHGYSPADATQVIQSARDIFHTICANSPKVKNRKVLYVDAETRLIDRLRISKISHIPPQDIEDKARDTKRGKFRKYADTHPIEPIDGTAAWVTNWPDPLL